MSDVRHNSFNWKLGLINPRPWRRCVWIVLRLIIFFAFHCLTHGQKKIFLNLHRCSDDFQVMTDQLIDELGLREDSVFLKLGSSGLISFSDYIFLLTLLSSVYYRFACIRSLFSFDGLFASNSFKSPFRGCFPYVWFQWWRRCWCWRIWPSSNPFASKYNTWIETPWHYRKQL